ncbi:metallophosphoesterase [Pontivivens ytuae]|uniref:Metallophosphoesterase n=1 Tax=Pontivivens ytuae TaxID=2789856 RepID=A0A7S9QD05_9RHOB|nr:metallophosphoesterase [Pontivivens ytuae]QPH54783.1 metallophosphoesterase [Pontivivens ytuae]
MPDGARRAPSGDQHDGNHDMKLIHISDTHLVAPGAQLLGLDPDARLREVIASVNLNHPDADLCIFSGDLTDSGDLDSYVALQAILRDLALPYRLMLGNHDHRSHFTRVFPEHVHSAEGFVQTLHRGNDADLLLLDSLNDAHPATGRLCDARLGWLERALQAPTERPLIVFVHHPPFDIGMPWFRPMLLENGADVLALLLAHDRVAHLAFGHVHLDTNGVHRGLSFSSTRGTAHKIAFSESANETFYTAASPGYDVLLATETGVIVHHETPRDWQSLIAREQATADGKGIFEIFGRPQAPSHAGGLL